MADQKVTELVEELAPALSDLLYMVDDPGSTPASKKVTIEALLNIFNLVGFSASLAGSQTIAHNTETVLQITSEQFDLGSHFNTANYRWTPPAGYVFLRHNTYWHGCVEQAQGSYIRKNGSAVAKYFARYETDVNNPGSSSVIWMGVADGDDYFEASVMQYRGSNLDVDGANFAGFVIPQS